MKAMDGSLRLILLLHISIALFLFVPYSSGLPLCINSRAPSLLNTTLPFCNYTGRSCCDANEDNSLRQQFEDSNTNNTSCGAFLKSILCAVCDPFAYDLFPRSENGPKIPLLCNGSAPSNSLSSAVTPFCEQVWDSCRNVSIKNSPFGSQGLLSERWKSKADFCQSFGGFAGEEGVCFDGQKSTSFGETQSSPPPNGVCFERVENGSYLDIAPHPDGSNRVFLSTKDGKIYLATVPDQDSGETMDVALDNPFMDLTDIVHSAGEFGLLGLAFHPEFVSNGRFFVSYNCDKTDSPNCSGRCSCNKDVNCDPLKLETEPGSQPCQYFNVIAEFSANISSSSPSKATTANPTEIRRILTLGLPFTSNHGGQILFGPNDGYLYYMIGDGGSNGDPWNFAQNKNGFLGKILRLDVNGSPSKAEIDLLGGWGTYSVPKDNPFVGQNGSRPEIWALGFRNPWRCDFDRERPEYLFCLDVGQNAYEEVNLVTKGGNYGWRVFEGPDPYYPLSSPGGNTSASSIDAIPPVLGYAHKELNPNTESAALTGGHFYRSSADPCLYGKFLFADLYATAMWVGSETPANSGNFSRSPINFTCAADSPIPCATQNSGLFGAIFSLGEDNAKDVYVLSNNGVHRIVRSSRCGYACAKEVPGSRRRSPPSEGRRSSAPSTIAVFSVSLILMLLGFGL